MFATYILYIFHNFTYSVNVIDHVHYLQFQTLVSGVLFFDVVCSQLHCTKCGQQQCTHCANGCFATSI